MASIEYAKMILRIAGEQHANREAVVTKLPVQAIREKSGGAPQTWGEGSVGLPSYEYTGSAGKRLAPSDPHRGLFAVAFVESFLTAFPVFTDVYRRLYVEGKYRACDQGAYGALAKELARHIGPIEEEATVVASHVKAWRAHKARARAEYVNAWKRNQREMAADTGVVASLTATSAR